MTYELFKQEFIENLSETSPEACVIILLLCFIGLVSCYSIYVFCAWRVFQLIQQRRRERSEHKESDSDLSE